MRVGNFSAVTDKGVVLDDQRSNKNNPRKLLVVGFVTFFIVVNVLSVVVTALTLSRVKFLENEVDDLRSSMDEMKHVQDKLNEHFLPLDEDVSCYIKENISR